MNRQTFMIKERSVNRSSNSLIITIAMTCLLVACGTEKDNLPDAPTPSKSELVQSKTSAPSTNSQSQVETASADASVASDDGVDKNVIKPIKEIDISGVNGVQGLTNTGTTTASTTANTTNPGVASPTTNAAKDGKDTWTQVCTIYADVCNTVSFVSKLMNSGKDTTTNTTTTGVH